ncbi:hypothetical protein L1O03_05430 [Corynebacterium uropygiale]|uniref:Uncharacterized protein n=1 Tax=Corynebacterium uropygiale TaxID=1775911 RepID=A0A9X1TXX2_9CORY|nr:DUF6676 family protein [Corynebacterium uropygiale]MCF4006620.1 hypothetical protein [Corynebacterium uropygiale]
MDVDLPFLVQQLNEDHVAFEHPGVPGHPFEAREGDLIHVSEQAEQEGFGSVGLVIVDEDPAVHGDLLNVGRDLQGLVDLDTIILRSPTMVDVVSRTHHRAELEIARHDLVQNLDPAAYPEQVAGFIHQVDGYSFPWGATGAVGIIALIALLVTAWRQSIRRPAATTRP